MSYYRTLQLTSTLILLIYTGTNNLEGTKMNENNSAGSDSWVQYWQFIHSIHFHLDDYSTVPVLTSAIQDSISRLYRTLLEYNWIAKVSDIYTKNHSKVKLLRAKLRLFSI